MLLCAFVVSLTAALAQTKVSGVVTHAEDGEPVIGATVKVKGTKLGALTDANGRFELSIQPGTVISITMMGMNPVEMRAKENMHISMNEGITEMDEVMVVAYGTAKKSAFTGSAAVLDSKDIQKTANSNAVDALRGKVTGVQINSASGQPGNESFSILIRGISSITAESTPLIIMDGAPFSGDINTINTSDIESMTVLKDAASAALYGARGANGVIIMTTKSAGRSGGKVTVDAKWGSNSRAIPDYNYVKSPAKYYEMWYGALNSYAKNELNYNEYTANRYANQNMINNATMGLGYNVYNVPTGEYMIGLNGKLNPNATLGNLVTGQDGNQYLLTPDDWVDALYQNGLRQEYTVTGTGGNHNGGFYISANYLNNEGITMKSGFDRFTGRLKADYQLKPWLKLAGNVSYAHYESDYLDDGDSSDSGSAFAVRTGLAPIYPIYYRDATGQIITNSITGGPSYDYGDKAVYDFSRPVFTTSNPLQDILLQTQHNEGNAVNATGSVEIRFLKDFTFSSINTVMLDEFRGNYTSQGYFGQGKNHKGYVSVSHGRTWKYNYQQLLSWAHQYGQHEIDVMVGHEYYRSNSYSLGASKSNMFSLTNTELNGAIIDGSMSSSRSSYNVEGWFGRAQYNYAQKYFGSVSFRRDGSSRFHPDNRWGNFWSVGAAWLMNKENWFQKMNADWINELKLKASYGQQGNDNIPDYLYTDRYSVVNNNGSIALTPSSVKANKNITWETGGNFNAGIEFSLFKHRLSGSIDGFYRKTSDMLFTFALPPSYGYTSYYDNIGDMANKGVEIELRGTPIRTRDLEWNLNANFTYYKNEITRLPDERKSLEVDGVQGYKGSGYFFGEGKSLWQWLMPRYAGVDPETGKALYWKDTYDTDADGNKFVNGQEKTDVYSDATEHLCGTALPKAYGGFGTSLSWKGFDVSVDFTYQLGGKVYDSSYASAMAGSRGSVFHADLLNSWTPENNTSNIPRMQYNDLYTVSTSDRFLTDASYLSLQNVNFGYTLPKNCLRKLHIEGLRVYMTANNLWLWSKRQGLDPRQSITGDTSNSYYSPIRTISGGVTITL